MTPDGDEPPSWAALSVPAPAGTSVSGVDDGNGVAEAVVVVGAPPPLVELFPTPTPLPVVEPSSLTPAPLLETGVADGTGDGEAASVTGDGDVVGVVDSDGVLDGDGSGDPLVVCSVNCSVGRTPTVAALPP